jgi:alcohol dehydrogenase (cytochrome c)
MAILVGVGRTPRAAGQAALQARSVECRVENVDYEGWKAQQISNRWVQLIIVPQNGGRLMQVRFNGHGYLFVNPKLAGKYLLWHFNTGQMMHASPMSYAVDGAQYVAIAAGSDVFSFSLPH